MVALPLAERLAGFGTIALDNQIPQASGSWIHRDFCLPRRAGVVSILSRNGSHQPKSDNKPGIDIGGRSRALLVDRTARHENPGDVVPERFHCNSAVKRVAPLSPFCDREIRMRDSPELPAYGEFEKTERWPAGLAIALRIFRRPDEQVS